MLLLSSRPAHPIWRSVFRGDRSSRGQTAPFLCPSPARRHRRRRRCCCCCCCCCWLLLLSYTAATGQAADGPRGKTGHVLQISRNRNKIDADHELTEKLHVQLLLTKMSFKLATGQRRNEIPWLTKIVLTFLSAKTSVDSAFGGNKPLASIARLSTLTQTERQTTDRLNRTLPHREPHRQTDTDRPKPPTHRDRSKQTDTGRQTDTGLSARPPARPPARPSV